ncbi:MAG: selenocysteine-specific translation elongation factor [Terriglobia bacterium]
MKHIIVGTAGHIDHGKSALVMALTGMDPDRLEEEKRRGITIDLGFAHLSLGDGLRIAFVDVPGHERFVKNMLAGATGVDVLLLVVAADESIKPQTREHFEICRLLGVRQGIVAINKSDLVDADILNLVMLEVQELVAGSFLEGAPVIAVSSRTGDGLQMLKDALYNLSMNIAAKPATLPFRLPVDRAFVMKGFGSVVTGTLIAGKIEKEEEVEIFPLGRSVRVRGIEVHNQPTPVAIAGQRAALNLTGVEVKELRRGMMLARPGEFQTTNQMDCSLRLLRSARPLRNRARVHFHCWAAETVAEVVLLEGKELGPGGTGYAQLRLAEPGLFLPGDRFIIRQFSPLVTMGGGEVLDSFPPRHRAHDTAPGQFLEALEKSDAESRLELLLRVVGESSVEALAARTGWAAAEVVRLGQVLAQKKRLLVLGQPPGLLLHADALEAISKSILQNLARFHTGHALIKGMGRDDLRGQVRVPVRGVPAQPGLVSFNAALQSLAAAREIRLENEWVALAGREIRLSREEQVAKEALNRIFEEAGLRVPTPSEALASLRIDDARGEKILQILLREKVLHKIGESMIFHDSALKGLHKLLAMRKEQDARLSVAKFKELTGVSRKYAIPLLEYLDRERVTRRSGDNRIIL